MYTKGLFLSIIVHKSVEMYVSEYFSFDEIFHSIRYSTGVAYQDADWTA